MAQTVLTILSPKDVKPGALDPKGRLVVESKLYFDLEKGVIAVDATFDNGESAAFMWPSGKGWTVDGNVG